MNGHSTLKTIVIILAVGVCGLGLAAETNQDILAGLKARSIGPANMSGRIGWIEVAPSNPNVIYVGAAAGGVWKSVNSGLTWEPVFDDQPVASIGAIAVHPRNADQVWVGTGEAAPRNSVSVGRGVYRSNDGGKTWKLMGLEKTEKISEIVIHPDNPDVVLVGALGATWGDSAERGVYKTIDGGKTWRRVLYVNEKTGVSDLAMDPSNPNKILAAMWEHRRWPWFFSSGGPGSGIHITTDFGEKWEKQTEKNGLPAGDLGRCGVAFATNKPEIAYALVEAKKNVLLKSTDGGLNWQVANSDPTVHNRPFYYSRIQVNPAHEDILYMLQTQLQVSEDGGKTFRGLTAFNQAHSDHHAMWIHPDGEWMIAGNDGGVVISSDRGKSWRFVESLPLGQFYHVRYDMQIPYYVYGGLQDNGTWRGPAYSLTERAVFGHAWLAVGGGDGFDAAPDPEDPTCGYGMSQGGNLYYYDIKTGTNRAIVPTESEVKHRYNWNAGFAIDPFKPATIYYGSQFVHRSPDKGRTWEITSPDLTTNDPEKQKQSETGGLTLDISSAENHCTIISIEPSPIKEGLIWVGTDDGNVQLTRDAGKTWELVSQSLVTGKKPPAPKGAFVPHIQASQFNEAAAYIVLDDHRRSNFTPYVLATGDYGKTWKSLATAEIDGYCMVIREDPVDKSLLFLGTEFGLFVSFDGGGKWAKWTQGVPTCPVYDLAIHPRENDLIIATHGRALYVIDDISPLREFSEEVAKKKLHLFPVPEARQFQQGRMSPLQSPGDTIFAGENKPQGARITYYLTPTEKKPEEKPETGGPAPTPQAGTAGQAMFGGSGMRGQERTNVQITILDSQGKFVSQLFGPEKKGINRAYWNFLETEPPSREGQPREEQAESRAMMFGRRAMSLQALPGMYTVKVKYEDQEATGALEVKPDPRLKIDLEVLKANYEKGKAAQALSRAVMQAGRQLQQTQRAIQTVKEYARTGKNPKADDITKAADEIEKKLKELTEALDPTPLKQGMADRSQGLNRQVTSAVSGITGAAIEPVSQAAQTKYDKVRPRAEEFLNRVNEFYEKDVENFKRTLQESGFTLFSPVIPIKIE
jgi:photosystem II stability/assembly factor-like uncharacterized protein